MRILFIFLIVLIIYFTQRRVYISNCFKKLSAEVIFSSNSVFQSEELKASVSLINKKALPLWWLGIQFNIPRKLVLLENKNKITIEDNNLKDMFFIMSYEKIIKHYPIIAANRGYYTIDSIELRCGDIFGDYRILKKFDTAAKLYVYPRLLHTEQLNIIFKRLIGDIVTKRHAIEDPFLLKGIREYSPFDSMKLINWKATARTGELKVNQYDSTYGSSVCILLDVSGGNSWFPSEITEESIRLSASLSSQFLLNGLDVEFSSNGKNILTNKNIKLPCINNSISIYEALSLLNINDIDYSSEEMLKNELIVNVKHKTIIFISPHAVPEIQELVIKYRHNGFDIKWLVPEYQNFKYDLAPMEDLYLWEVKNL